MASSQSLLLLETETARKQRTNRTHQYLSFVYLFFVQVYTDIIQVKVVSWNCSCAHQT